MKSSVLGMMGIAATVAVAGCSDADDYNQVAEAEANKQALDRLNQETEVSKSLLASLQQQDPTIVDTQYVLDENGQRTMRVARQTEDGQIQTWQAPAEEFSQAEAQAQQEAGGGGSGLTNMLIAGMAGYMIASMFSGAGATQAMSPAAYQQQRQRSSTAYASSVRQSSLGAAARRAMPASANSVGRTQGGSFAGSGARSGGYASGG